MLDKRKYTGETEYIFMLGARSQIKICFECTNPTTTRSPNTLEEFLLSIVT